MKQSRTDRRVIQNPNRRVAYSQTVRQTACRTCGMRKSVTVTSASKPTQQPKYKHAFITYFFAINPPWLNRLLRTIGFIRVVFSENKIKCNSLASIQTTVANCEEVCRCKSTVASRTKQSIQTPAFHLARFSNASWLTESPVLDKSTSASAIAGAIRSSNVFCSSTASFCSFFLAINCCSNFRI